MGESSQPLPLGLTECDALAEALGDTVETVIWVHLLRRGLCDAYVVGEPARFDAAVVQAHEFPSEPAGYGRDPEALWHLLRALRGWDCVNVSEECGCPLGQIMGREMGVPVRHYGDVYYVLRQRVADVRHPAVRELTVADVGLLEAAHPDVRGGGFGNARALLEEGIVAAAVVGGKVVSVAYTYARTERHVDIGVCTLEPWRNRGFATAAASSVARRTQEAGQTPTWSTGEDNAASVRVAEKLGFREVSRRVYLIPEEAG
jgi:GNAT superfamily N-acetyltransferase